MPKISGIYAISDENFLDDFNLAQKRLKATIAGGIAAFQLRDKKKSDSMLLQKALILQEICQKNKVQFVLNDRVELAINSGFLGLHIGKIADEKTPYSLKQIAQIRKNFSGYLGVSCYGDLKRAKECAKIGVDLVGFGSCFKSSTKPNAPQISLEIFTKFRSFCEDSDSIKKPDICAIGGINKDNANLILNADLLALSAGIWQDGDEKIAQNIKQISQKFAQN